MADAVKPPETEDEFLLQAGVNPDVVRANEGVLNNEQIGLLKVKHGAAVTNMFVSAVENKKEKALTQAKAADEKRVVQIKELFKDFDVPDPDKLFNEMREWARATYTKEEFAELQADTKKGGRAQKAALKEIAEGFLKANPMSVKEIGGVDGDTLVATNPNYITASEYTDKLRALQKRGLGDSSNEVKALNAQRMTSRKQEHK